MITIGSHVHRIRPQPLLSARHPASRVLSRRRQGQEAHPRQPLQLVSRAHRGIPGPAQGRNRGATPRRCLRHRPLPSPRSCRRGAGDTQEARPREADRPEAVIEKEPGAGHDRGTHPGARLEARHGKGAARGHGGEHSWRDPRCRARRGRSVWRHGLAPGAPGEDRAGSGQAASR